MQDKNREPNSLIHSSSPYLLQHAYNPVDWHPWGEEALNKALREDKPIIVSIGYSACHWCHVMEKESFEDQEVADFMNLHYVCIKVDREERPDIDAIYMDAIQAMGQRGGWPLNALLTPDTKPFYAATYLPKGTWLELLQNAVIAFKQQREEINESANGIASYISQSELEKFSLQDASSEFSAELLEQMYQNLAKDFDTERGGMNRAPKFPMPAIYQFLLHYYQISKNPEALKQIELSLNEMAKGGIYDQIGGGFARYSVDADWLVPHFEKMLYDNAQLISVFADAYAITKNNTFKTVVYQTIDFLEKEMLDEENGFYSALDADTEGEEGKFYVWSATEIEEILGEDINLCKSYYNITAEGNWEAGKNILHRKESDEAFCEKHDLHMNTLNDKRNLWQEQLLTTREKRTKPGIDDKILCSWNALTAKALCDAYKVFGEAKFYDLAQKNIDFIRSKMKNKGQLYHSYKKGKASISAYLEDYASLIQALIAFYQISFEIKYLQEAHTLSAYCLDSFFDNKEELFFFTDKHAEALIARKKEIFDNVIPSSNSIMGQNLFWLGHYFSDEKYLNISRKMTLKISEMIVKETGFLCNWAALYALHTQQISEVVIVGDAYQTFSKTLYLTYLPYKIILASKTENNDLPLFESRGAINAQTTIYICQNKACQLPVNTVQEALNQL